MGIERDSEGGRDLNGLYAIVREIRDGQIRLEEQAKTAADHALEQATTSGRHAEKINALELANARTEGSIRVLLWLVPGGPALVMLIGAAALWATRG